MQQKKLFTTIAIVIGVVLGLLVTVGLFLFFSYRSVIVKPNSPTQATGKPNAPSATPTPTPDPDRDFGVLLMGYGGLGHDGGYLTDTMILAYVQPRKERLSLITIPRDLWVPLSIVENEDPKHFKINAAYAIGRDDKKYSKKPVQYTGNAGGGVLAMDTISMVTGLNVEHFASLSFDGFKKSVDVLNGVEVQVPQTFDDFFYPIKGQETNTCGFSETDIATATAALKGEKLEQFFTCRYEHLHFDKGQVHMDGETALKFVRSRHSAQSGGDFARSLRQKALLAAVREQIFTVGFLPKLVPFVTSLKQDAQTDIDVNNMAELISKADQFRGFEIQSIAISEKDILINSTSADRQYILIPKEGMDQWTSIHNYLQDELNGIEATLSATPIKNE